MDKRYQVFISSTFQDLEGARQEVSQALLRADCFPAGMELFPAADEEQFEFIKQVIDQSDYYIVISAGRYGSIHPEKGLSYTELEYDYAVETGKSVIRLLHKDPFKKLAGEFIEQSDDGRELLRAFREKLSKGSMVNFWEDPKELGQLVVFGLMDARKRKPAIGWVRADGRATPEAEREIAELKQRIAELELEIERRKVDYLDAGRIIENFVTNYELVVVHKNYEPGGDVIEVGRESFSATESEICTEICVSCLSSVKLTEIEYDIYHTLCSKNSIEFESFDEMILEDGKVIKRLLHKLESYGVIFSSPGESSQQVWSRSQVWELTEDTRRWASAIASTR